MKYRLISGSAREVEAGVNAAILEGFRPIGGVASPDGWAWGQAMISEEEAPLVNPHLGERLEQFAERFGLEKQHDD